MLSAPVGRAGTLLGSPSSFAVSRTVSEPATPPQGSGNRPRSAEELLAEVTIFADDLASRPNTGDTAAPLAELQHCSELGLFTAPLPRTHGGVGLGTESGNHASLLRLLALLGGADLALARLYEGHVNALILIAAYGSPEQLDSAAQEAARGSLFAVWNTGDREPLRIAGNSGGYQFSGSKTFASGADFVRRPLVTAELPENGGWQMTLPRIEAPEVADALKIDRSFWHPFGMESSESYRIDFTGAGLLPADLIGQPGDFYRDPLFRGGAIRFAAVHAGAILRLHRMFAEWLDGNHRGSDPYQVARLGEITLASQAAALWIDRAASAAEECLHVNAEKVLSDRMVQCANMTRLAIARLATDTMLRITEGVGARGLLRPHRFERVIRDLTTYLRQPAPDETLAEVGRASLRKTWTCSSGATEGFWADEPGKGSLPPSYFKRVYERSEDPWNFQSSEYEAGKYADTLRSLPPGPFESALEIGCSIGVLTSQLAACCDALLALDVSDKALAAARERCAGLPQVQFRCMEFPREVPDGIFDLVVVSEVAYYWHFADLERAAASLAAHQAAGAHLLLVHLTETVPDYPLTGDQVHDAWLARPEWKSISGHRAARYRVDLLQRV